MFQSPGSIAFHLGPLSVRWYGLLIALGIVLCFFYIMAELKRRKLNTKPVEDMAFWVILFGILGARIYYVLFNLDYYVANPLDIFAVWKGGLAIHGGLIAGGAAFFVFVFRHKLSWRLYGDIIIPGVILAQGIGRWGNFFNSEAFGRPTNLPWKLFIPVENRPEQYANFEFYHPTFLYESLWDFAGFALLLILSRVLSNNPQKAGTILFVYLIWYSVGRFFIESLRLDSLYFGPLRTAQISSVILFVVGICGLIFVSRKARISHTT